MSLAPIKKLAEWNSTLAKDVIQFIQENPSVMEQVTLGKKSAHSLNVPELMAITMILVGRKIKPDDEKTPRPG